jgi:4-amino-4-deoxy-L-arabinose transferase-like glycosyltransferase
VAVALPATTRARPRRLRPSAIPRPLRGLLIASALLSIAWAITMAPLQGPDEHNHLGYVQQLAETGSGPDFGETAGQSWSTEQIQWMSWQSLLSLIGVIDGRPGWNPAEQQRFDDFLKNPPADYRKDGTGPNPVGQNPPAYYAYESVPYWLFRWTELPTRLLAMRLANLPLYLLIVTFAWLAAGEVFAKRRRAQTIAAGSVGLLPQLAFMSGVVNPDIMLATVWAAFAYLALLAVRLGPKPSVLIGLGGVAGLSVLSHPRGLAGVPALILVLAVVLWQARPWTAKMAAWVVGCFATLVVLAIGALSYSSAHGGASSIGGEVGSTTGAGSIKGFLSYVWEFYLPALRTMSPQGPAYGYRQVYVEGLGGTFGSLEITYPLWVYDVLQLAAGIGLILLVLCITRRWETVRAKGAQVLVVVALPLSMLAVLHVSAYRDLQGPPFDPLLVGRYLLPLLVPMGLAIAFVCTSLPKRVGATLGTLVLTTFTVLSFTGLALTITRFYT